MLNITKTDWYTGDELAKKILCANMDEDSLAQFILNLTAGYMLKFDGRLPKSKLSEIKLVLTKYN